MGHCQAQHYVPAFEVLENRRLLSHSAVPLLLFEHDGPPSLVHQEAQGLNSHGPDHQGTDTKFSADFSEPSSRNEGSYQKHLHKFQSEYEGRQDDSEHESKYLEHTEKESEKHEQGENRTEDASRNDNNSQNVDSGQQTKQQTHASKEDAKQAKGVGDVHLTVDATATTPAPTTEHPSSAGNGKSSSPATGPEMETSPANSAGSTKELTSVAAPSSPKPALAEAPTVDTAAVDVNGLKPTALAGSPFLADKTLLNAVAVPENPTRPSEVLVSAVTDPARQLAASSSMEDSVENVSLMDLLWMGLMSDTSTRSTSALEDALVFFQSEIDRVESCFAQTLGNSEWAPWLEAMLAVAVVLEAGRRQVRKRQSKQMAAGEGTDPNLSWFPGMPGSFTLD